MSAYLCFRCDYHNTGRYAKLMKEREPLTVLIPAGNERDNIRDCLESVKWADDIFVVVDERSDDGTEEITLDMSNAEDGWFLLGTFYFSKGRATVDLTDESKGRIVIADAVRWTLRE